MFHRRKQVVILRGPRLLYEALVGGTLCARCAQVDVPFFAFAYRCMTGMVNILLGSDSSQYLY